MAAGAQPVNRWQFLGLRIRKATALATDILEEAVDVGRGGGEGGNANLGITNANVRIQSCTQEYIHR